MEVDADAEAVESEVLVSAVMQEDIDAIKRLLESLETDDAHREAVRDGVVLTRSCCFKHLPGKQNKKVVEQKCPYSGHTFWITVYLQFCNTILTIYLQYCTTILTIYLQFCNTIPAQLEEELERREQEAEAQKQVEADLATSRAAVQAVAQRLEEQTTADNEV